MARKKKSSENAEALRFDNEFLKAKIAAEYGAAHVFANAGEDMPPDLENEFLNNIIRFEETKKGANEIPIYDFIGRPEFVREEDLRDADLSAELERVNGLLNDKNIVCHAICPVDDRVLYKFLTEELFQQPIMEMWIPEMTANYIYEEFHPNHEYDTRKRCEDFIKVFFAGDFHEQIRYYSPEHIRNFAELKEFRDCFCEFRNVEYEVFPSECSPDDCTRKARISFDALTSPGTTPIHFSGEAVFKLEYEFEWWTVVSLVLPGMVRLN